MATDKRISYINQDGYKNYIKNSDSITIPKKFKARKKATSTHLAYITKAEAAQLKKQNKGTPHKGPKGVPSYDSFDAAGGYSNPDTGYAASSGGGGGGWQDSGRADAKVNEMAEQVRRNYVNKENIRSSPLHDRYNPNWKMGGARSGIGGLFGALGRGALGFFGGVPGKLLSGIMTAKNWAGNQGSNLLGGVKEFSEHDNLLSYLNRNKVQAIQPVESIPTNQEIIGKRVGQDQGYYGMGSQYDQSRVMPSNITSNMGANNFNNAVPNNELFTDNNLMAFNTGSPLDQKINQAHNIYNETGFGKGNLQELMKMDMQNKEDTGEPLSLPKSTYTMFGADGGIARLL